MNNYEITFEQTKKVLDKYGVTYTVEDGELYYLDYEFSPDKEDWLYVDSNNPYAVAKSLGIDMDTLMEEIKDEN